MIALFTLAFFGSTQVVRPWTTDIALLLAAFAGLFAVAMLAQARGRPGRRPGVFWRARSQTP